MGVHYLIRNLEHINGRLPFKITFNSENNFNMENDLYLESYKEIGTGKLQYIGIDGSVIIHSKIVSDNNNNVNITKSAIEIVNIIIIYIETIIIFFRHFNKNDEIEKDIIIHFVVDGTPPCKKNRRKIIDDEGNETYIKDAYSLMSLNDKKKLYKTIINKQKYNNDKSKLHVY